MDVSKGYVKKLTAKCSNLKALAVLLAILALGIVHMILSPPATVTTQETEYFHTSPSSQNYEQNLKDGQSMAHEVPHRDNLLREKESPAQCLNQEKRLPQCVIIGVRKAGTRALINFLSIHPDIVSAQKEQNFFFSPKYERGLGYYRKKMPESCPGQITIEKTPAYFHADLKTPQRIKQMNESIKLLVIVREPVARAVSEYLQFDYKYGRQKPFEFYAFKQAKKGAKHERNDSALYRDDYTVDGKNHRIRLSQYYYNAKRWLNYFPRKQIHFVNGDIIIKDPVSELRKIETFLGLSHNITKDNFFFSKDKGFFCWRNWDESEQCLSNSKGRPHPKLDEEHEKALIEYYKPYNKKFFELIGQDFGWPT